MTLTTRELTFLTLAARPPAGLTHALSADSLAVATRLETRGLIRRTTTGLHMLTECGQDALTGAR
jgi:hypothetical protein